MHSNIRPAANCDLKPAASRLTSRPAFLAQIVRDDVLRSVKKVSRGDLRGAVALPRNRPEPARHHIAERIRRPLDGAKQFG
jgi:hypothetical protein